MRPSASPPPVAHGAAWSRLWSEILLKPRSDVFGQGKATPTPAEPPAPQSDDERPADEAAA
jgi:hypothetical protein